MIAAIMKYLFMNDTTIIDEDLVRHMILNSIRSINTQFKKDYGNLVISCDGRDYWRKELFPYYKIKRKKTMDESTIDWGELHTFMNKIKKEIEENFKYIVIQVDKAESDDIIGTLVRNFYNKENILICSRDHDFQQLQKYASVKQYNSIDRKFMLTEDIDKFLFEHICKGDSGDSIPNIFSPLNSIALNIRQKPAYQKKIDAWSETGVPEEYKERFELNKKLIDLSYTPEDLQTKIMEEYNKQQLKPKKNILNYFIKYGLREMASCLQEF
jgi:5'-3' exonuclease